MKTQTILIQRYASPLFLAVALMFPHSQPVRADADVVLDGIYHKGYGTDINQTSGYTTANLQTYIIMPSAKFDGNDIGLDDPENTKITINGGTFSDNKLYGFMTSHSSVTINSGSFIGNWKGLFADNSPLTITGGEFNNNLIAGLDADSSDTTITNATFKNNKKYGLYAEAGSKVTINGGIFGGNGKFDIHVQGGSDLTIVGKNLTFEHFTAATTRAASGGKALTGFIHGILRDNSQPSRLSYEIVNGGRIHLVSGPH